MAPPFPDHPVLRRLLALVFAAGASGKLPHSAGCRYGCTVRSTVTALTGGSSPLCWLPRSGERVGGAYARVVIRKTDEARWAEPFNKLHVDEISREFPIRVETGLVAGAGG
jgi:hypothetical protein